MGIINASCTTQFAIEARWKMPDGTEQAGPNMSFAGDGTPQTFTAWVPVDTADTFNCADESVTEIKKPIGINLKAIDCSGNPALALTDVFAEDEPLLTNVDASNTASEFTNLLAEHSPLLTDIDFTNTPSNITDDFAEDATGLLEVRVGGTLSVLTDLFAANAPGLLIVLATNTNSVFTNQFAQDAPGLVTFDATNTAASTLGDLFAQHAFGVSIFRAGGTNSIFTNQFALDAGGLVRFEANETDCSAIDGVFCVNAPLISILVLVDAQIPQAGVDSILAQLLANGVLNGTVDLSGASMGVPGVQGAIDAGLLVTNNSWLVITN